VLLVALSGCPGSLDDPDRFRMPTCGGVGQPVCNTTTSTLPPTTLEVQTYNLKPKCGFAGCHAGAVPGGQLDLEKPNLEARLRASTSTTVICNGRPMLTPGSPDTSLMWTKLADLPPCGTKMPQVGTLTADETAKLRRWIEGLR
jgi:hypothetical protein